MANIKIFGKELVYNAYRDGMYEYNIRVRFETDKTFIKVFQYNVTDAFFKMLKETIDPNFMFEANTVISISGKTGTGKSSVGISLAYLTLKGQRFSDKNICFFDQEILELAPSLPRDSFIIRDEGMDKATFGVGSNRTSRQLQALAETCRKAGLNLIFIEPEFVPNDITKYYLETIDMDIDNRLTRVAVRDGYTKQYIGALYVPVLPKDNLVWINYNLKKDRFIDSIRSGNMSGAKADYETLAKNMAQEIDLDRFSKTADRLIFVQLKNPNLTTQEQKIIHRLMELELKGKTGERIAKKHD